MQSNTLYSTKVILNLLKDLVFFPIWWYSFGLYNLLIKMKKFLKNRQRALAFFVWMKNIFVPMYGRTDIGGRLISFFVRLFQIIFRGLLMVFWVLVSFSVLFIWLALPIFSFYQIYFQVMN